jgi:radical SAM superfamily enzyme YgiQ (UPF0313 family)
MKVALIELGPSRPELHEPLAIETLAGYIDKYKGSDQFQIDLFSLSFDRDINEIEQYQVIAISTQIGTWNKLKDLLKRIQQNTSYKNQLIIVGGLLASYAPKEILALFKKVICVQYEGEYSFLELLKLKYLVIEANSTLDEKNLELIPNLVYFRNKSIVFSKSIKHNCSQNYVPRRDFASNAIERQSQVQLEGSRGCPWNKCTFCSIPRLNGKAWNPIDLNLIILQLIELSNLGAKSPYFTDADFLGNSSERLFEFSKILNTNKEKAYISKELNYYINLPTSGILGNQGNFSDEQATKLLLTLKKSGLREVFIGIESGAKHQVSRYKKASTAERNIRAIKKLKNLNIQTDIGFIMFDPFVTIEELKFNIQFIKKAGIFSHPSRLTKALRIQPQTSFSETYLNSNKQNLNLNNICYPYKFEHSNVSNVYRKFRAFELTHLDYCTLVQGASKGEVQNESTRLKLRNYLGTLRAIDLMYLEACVIAETEGNLDSDKLSEIEEKLNIKFIQKFHERPVEIDKHFSSLGIQTSINFFKGDYYQHKYRTLNVYEDPVIIENKKSP